MVVSRRKRGRKTADGEMEDEERREGGEREERRRQWEKKLKR